MNKAGIVVVVLIVAAIGGILFVQSSRTEDNSDNTSVRETLDLPPAATDREPENEEIKNEVPEEETVEMAEQEYQGEVLAGNDDLLFLDFTQADYDKAKAEGKSIFHYFYASWCSICKNEIRNSVVPAFNSASTDNVIGFLVNYNDSETTSQERALASEFGVSSQHTKVLLVDGEVQFKDPSTWNESRFIDELEQI